MRIGREKETQGPSTEKQERRWSMEQGRKCRSNYYKSATMEIFDNL